MWISTSSRLSSRMSSRVNSRLSGKVRICLSVFFHEFESTFPAALSLIPHWRSLISALFYWLVVTFVSLGLDDDWRRISRLSSNSTVRETGLDTLVSKLPSSDIPSLKVGIEQPSLPIHVIPFFVKKSLNSLPQKLLPITTQSCEDVTSRKCCLNFFDCRSRSRHSSWMNFEPLWEGNKASTITFFQEINSRNQCGRSVMVDRAIPMYLIDLIIFNQRAHISEEFFNEALPKYTKRYSCR